MLHTDSAYAMLSEALQEQDIEIESNEINEREVTATASANGVDIDVWFDADSQQFGFNMLTGGSKKYNTIEDFVKYFKTYFDISTELVPKAKLISNICEEELGINTIYDSFKGNKSSGYYVVFRVLGDDKRELQITQDKKDNSLYKAEIVLYNEGKTQKKAEHEFLYEVTEDMNVRELVTLDSYITGLSKYDDDANIELRRIGAYEFVITYNDSDIVHYSITIETGKVIYHIKEYCDKEFTPAIDIELKDALDLYGLKDLISQRVTKKEKKKKKEVSNVDELLDESGNVLHGIEEVEVSKEELREIGEIKESNMDMADELMQSARDNETDTEEDTTNNVESFEEESADITNTANIENTANIDNTDSEQFFDTKEPESEINNTIESDENIEIEYVKLIKTEGRITGVLFITKDKLYRVSKEVALEFIPLNVIEEYTDCSKKRGITLTDEEKARKVFAKDVSYDKEFCEKLVVALFD